jgi:hypothetical protein
MATIGQTVQTLEYERKHGRSGSGDIRTNNQKKNEGLEHLKQKQLNDRI